jgi:hypothetical protein
MMGSRADKIGASKYASGELGCWTGVVTHQQERSDGQTKHRITETKWLKTGDGAARVTASIYGTNQTDQKERQIFACMAAVVACMKRKRSPNPNSPAEPTHSLMAGETSPNHTSRLMIKTWIHGQLLCLLYSRNMHGRKHCTGATNQLPTLTKQRNHHNVAEHRGKMVITGETCKVSSYKMVTVHPSAAASVYQQGKRN